MREGMKQKLIKIRIYKAVDSATGDVSMFAQAGKRMIVANWTPRHEKAIYRRHQAEYMLCSGFTLSNTQQKRMKSAELIDEYHACLLIPNYGEQWEW